MRPAVVLFAKAPVPGRVKTRLQPQYTAEQAVALHEASVRDMVATLRGMAPAADIELHTDTDTDAWRDLNVARRLQPAGDLGVRMYQTLNAGIKAGRPRVMIVGSDAPTLPGEHLARLLHLEADVALGPVTDGGYYAIACRAVHREMFAGVEWSTGTVREQTQRACEVRGLSVALGPEWFDVDTPEDLRRLADSPALPSHTRDWMLIHAKELRGPGNYP